MWTTPTIAAEAGDHMESAMAECTRTEANLGALLRGLNHLTAGATAAREANATLLQELDAMRELLDRSNEHEMSLRGRVRALEQALENAERDAALARAVLIEQEDLFIAELLTDHERVIVALEHRLLAAQTSSRTLSPPPPAVAREAVPVRSAAPVATPELDTLSLDENELEELDSDERPDSRVVPISTMPPPPNFEADIDPISTMPPPPDFEPDLGPPSVSLSAPAVPSVVAPSGAEDATAPSPAESRRVATLTLRTIVIGPQSGSAGTVPEPATTVAAPDATRFESGAAATPLGGASIDADLQRESKPPLKQKPDPSTRPLVGYSLGSDEVAEEVVDVSRLGPRAPR
jgi:hypothetical protein